MSDVPFICSHDTLNLPHHKTCFVTVDSYDLYPCKTASPLRAGSLWFFLLYHQKKSLAHSRGSMNLVEMNA